MHQRLAPTLAFLFVSTGTIASAAFGQQLPFFPGAEGFGGNFTGTAPAGGWFSNATVYHVTRTDDALDAAGKPVQGTLRRAFLDSQLKQNLTNSVIVFDVGGTFQLTQGSLDIKTVNNLYVAGQTAPSPVVVYGNTTQITHSSNTVNSNVILRYMTFRKGTGDGADAVTFSGGGSNGAGSVATNMILDHVSASWSEDEDLSVTNNNTNVTVQYSVIADSLTTGHAYGSLLRAQTNSSVTFHHNLYANNASRQARFGSYNANLLTADFVNNVIYNWRDRASYAGGSSEPEQEYADVNYIGNYLVAGPSTAANADKAFLVDKNVTLNVYQSGNYIDSDKQVNVGGQPNGANTGWGMFAYNTPVTDQIWNQLSSPVATPGTLSQTANDAYWQVVNYAGNFWWNRDAIDARIHGNVLNNTNPPAGVAAAAPDATELAGVLGAPVVTRVANWDTDDDGMPDAWELSHGLNPNSATDLTLDFDSDGYVNVVEYLNDTGAFPAPSEIVFSPNGLLPVNQQSRYARTENWSVWQPSRFDTVRINAGTSVVDSVGQHAGTLRIGTAGTPAGLSVTSGWIEVANLTEVGATGTLSIAGSGSLFTATLNSATSVANAGTIACTAGGTMNGMTGTGTFYVLGGTLTTTGAIRQNALNVSNGAVARVAANGAILSKVSTLNVNSTGTLDLNDNDLVVAGGAGTYASVNAKLGQGYNSGDWSGTGIRSTSAAGAGNTALGILTGQQFLDNDTLGAGTFSGHTVAASDLLVKYTYQGDNNLDGSVDDADLFLFLPNYTGSQVGNWLAGDYTYDGAIDDADLFLFLPNYTGGASGLNAAMSTLGIEPTPAILAAESSGLIGSALVPEPATLSLLALGAGVLLRRRQN